MNFFGNKLDDTICALATPSGEGALALIRISGKKALEITKKIAPFLPTAPESHKLFYGFILDSQNQEIDQVLVSYFKHGQSFTGEESLEISCHGSRAVIDQILSELIKNGARVADRGEFTLRAFLNGKLDLIQAESVLSLIQSQSLDLAKEASRQLKGVLSERIEKIEKRITFCLAHLEASIDFSLENLETLSPQDMVKNLSQAIEEISFLIRSHQKGQLLKSGHVISLIGLPNAGKSSLFNLLAQEEKAIVTDIPGTTRDALELKINFHGKLLTFLDTAGIRNTDQLIEYKGIEKTFSSAEKAHFIFYVIDGGKGLQPEDLLTLKKINLENTIFIINKADLIADKKAFLENFETKLENAGHRLSQFLDSQVLFVSSLSEKDLSVIEKWLEAKLNRQNIQDPLIIQKRQFEILSFVLEKVLTARKQIEANFSPEISALSLHEALQKIHEIQGKSFDEEVLNRIFKEFCIGK